MPSKTNMETIGQRIARIRKQKGYTQGQLAKIMGITQGLASAYELGRLQLKADIIIQYAIALKVSADEILGLKSSDLLHVDTKISLKLVRRMQKIDSLPTSEQKVLLHTIDTFLKGAGR
jgi:transcriptional regulator with XRE-family HTH domain